MKKYFLFLLSLALAAYISFIPRTVLATDLPDLVLENVRITGLTLTYNVRNIGTASVFGSAHVAYGWNTAEGYTNSAFLGTFTIDLDPGETMGRTYNFSTLPSWVASVGVSVSPPWGVTELDPDNNRQTINLADVEPLPPLDFVVTAASLSGGRVDYAIRNNGGGSFDGAVTTRFIWINDSGENVFSGENLSHTLSGAFPAGGARSGSFTLGVPRPDATRVRVEVDSWNYLPETNETNNSLMVNIPTSYFADLTLANAVLEGDTITFDVRNIGGPYWAGLTDIRYTARRENGSTISSFTDSVLNVAPGATISHSFTLPSIPSAAASILVDIDFGHSIDEGNEGNNTLSVHVTLGSQLDFTVSAADFDITSANFTITNQGARAFNDILPHHLQWISGTGAVLATAIGGGPVNLPPGGSISYARSGDSFILGRPASAVYLRITVNPSGAMHVPEFDSDNNSYDINIASVLAEAFPPPDFSAESPEFLDPGFRFTLRNGGGDLDDVMTYRLEWLDNARSVLATNLGTFYGVLERDGAQLVTDTSAAFFYGRPDAAAYLRLTLNPTGPNHIEETNTANNALEVPYLPPPAPDFTATDGGLTSSAVTFAINNVGGGDFAGSLVYRLEWLNDSGTVLSTRLNAVNLPSLPAGASFVNTYGGDAFMFGRPASAARLRITLNPSSAFQIDEADATNNTLEVLVGSTPLPEPEVEDLPPDFTVEIDELTSQRARLTIGNVGEGDYAGLLTWRFSWLDNNGAVLSSMVNGDVVLLSPGETFSVTRENIPFLLGRPADATALRVIVNPNDGGAFVSSESNTSNNSAAREVIGRGLPDFSVDSLILNPTIVEFTARNAGGDSTGEVGYVVEWLNGSRETLMTGTGAIAERLPAGWAAVVRHSGSFVHARPGDAVYLRATVNPTGGALAVSETNLANNTAELRLIDDETSGADLVEEEEEEALDTASEEADDYAPERAPSGVSLFFRNIGQGLKSAFTTDPVDKAELRLRYANEKLVNAQLMSAEGEPERAARELTRYGKDMDKATTALERAIEKESDGAKQLVGRVLSNQLNHQVLLGAIEGAVDDKAPDVSKIRQTVSAGVGRTVELMEEDEATAVLTHELTKRGNPLSAVRALEVLAGVAAKAPEAAVDVIEKVQEHLADKFLSQYRALPAQNQRLVAEYVEKTALPEADKLKAIDSIKTSGEIGGSGLTDGERFISKAWSKTLQRFDQQIQEEVNAGGKGAASLLKAFERGTVADVRILSELENRLPDNVKPVVLPAKEKAVRTFVGSHAAFEKFKEDDIAPEIKLQVFDAVESFVKSAATKAGDIPVSKGVLQTLEIELPELKRASVLDSIEKISESAKEEKSAAKEESQFDTQLKGGGDEKLSVPITETKEKSIAPPEKKQLEVKQTEPVKTETLKTEVLKTDTVKTETPETESKTETNIEVKTETLKEESAPPIKETTTKETTIDETTIKETTTNETNTKTVDDSAPVVDTKTTTPPPSTSEKTTDTSGTTVSSTTKSTTDQSATKGSTDTKIYIKGY